jgi:hypothetical protein
MSTSWIPLVMGVVFIAGGLFTIVARVWVASSIANLQRATFGRFGEKLASQATPRVTAALGVYFVIFGVLMSSLSIASLLGSFGNG